MEKLSEEEQEKAFQGKCPICENQLYKGPQGGLAMNIKCKTCEAIIWLVPGVPQFGAEWVSKGNMATAKG